MPQLDTGIVAAVWMNLAELQESARARSPLVLKANSRCPCRQRNILYRLFMSTLSLPHSLLIWMLN